MYPVGEDCPWAVYSRHSFPFTAIGYRTPGSGRWAGQPVPDALTIASASSDGVPSARLVVLRGLRRGLVFFTDRDSDKGAELAANPQAAAVLHWLVPAHRQVRAVGPVEPVSQDEADEYWSARPP